MGRNDHLSTGLTQLRLQAISKLSMKQPVGKKDTLLIISLLLMTCLQPHLQGCVGSSPSQVARLAASARKTRAGTSITGGMGGRPTNHLASQWTLKGRHRAGMRR